MYDVRTNRKGWLSLAKTGASIITGGILAIIGGSLIMNSGFGTRSFIITVLSYSDQKFGSGLPDLARLTFNAAIFVLSAVIALGGLVAVLGGLLVLLKHRTMGKLLIALGGGMGFLGILISMGYDVVTTGLRVLATHFEYWIGIVIASVGRYLS